MAKMLKRVRVTVELPASFVGMLDTSMHMKAATEDDISKLDAAGILAWMVLMEARGATPEQIHAMTPPAWRDSDSPEMVHEERRVYGDGKLISGPLLLRTNEKVYNAVFQPQEDEPQEDQA
jgi:hypothetical protein